MNILVIGGGGREHALAWKLACSPKAQKVFVAPGNGGTALDVNLTNIPYNGITDIPELAEFALAHKVELTVVGPEAPLAAGVVDEPNARTRFVLVGCPGPPPPRTGADRTSVVLRVGNTPGALVAALSEFGIRGIDLTRIESRPTRTELGTYMFFLDYVGHIDDRAVAEALMALHRRCDDVRYLGSWPTGAAAGAVPPLLDEAEQWLARLRRGES